MSVNIKIVDAVKKYGELTVVKDLSLDIKEKELFTLLGPSGCGKTTLLRMIAGFNTIEGGQFYFNETLINNMDVSKSNIGMVFQNYAIFPHYTVKQNVEFGLKNRKVPKDQVSAQAEEFLDLMQILEYKDRMPEKLSGGQQQRVALARALVIKPDVLLMDEPLSNLDAKLRLDMRHAIREIQKEVGITTVYVTHDQEEAMAISDRIAVMNHGVIQQVDKPEVIYHRPSNTFVATFIGRTNLIEATFETKKGEIDCFGYKFTIGELTEQEKDVLLSVRPQDFMIQSKEEDGFEAKVIDSVFLGLNTHYMVETLEKTRIEIIKESSLSNRFEKGSTVSLKINESKINVFSKDGERNLLLKA